MELELSKRFYNHTAVALHDWHTYSQLALLAKNSLGIQVAVPELPGSVIDPGRLQSCPMSTLPIGEERLLSTFKAMLLWLIKICSISRMLEHKHAANTLNIRSQPSA